MNDNEADRSRSLAAIVVTFNRSAKLRKVLDSLEAQIRRPDRIYVVDNASTDETAEVVGSFDPELVRHLRLARNIGGAGGFNAGLRQAFEDGHDLFWISDDDVYADPDAIAVLENCLLTFDQSTPFRAPFACSRVDWSDGTLCNMNNPETVWDWPRWYGPDSSVFLVNSCSFVSVLISRWAVKEHGLPIKDYFIWHDDIEYTRRLARSYPGLYCPMSRVIHDTEQNVGSTLANLTAENLWKHRFGVRNQASRRLRDEGHFGYLSYARFVWGKMRAGKIPARLRFKIYRSLVSGYLFRPEIEFAGANSKEDREPGLQR